MSRKKKPEVQRVYVTVEEVKTEPVRVYVTQEKPERKVTKVTAKTAKRS